MRCGRSGIAWKGDFIGREQFTAGYVKNFDERGIVVELLRYGSVDGVANDAHSQQVSNLATQLTHDNYDVGEPRQPGNFTFAPDRRETS